MVATIRSTRVTAIVLRVIGPEGCRVLRRHVVGIGGAVCRQGKMRACRRRGGDRKAGCCCERPQHPEQECTSFHSFLLCGLRPIIVGRRRRSASAKTASADAWLDSVTHEESKVHRAHPRRNGEAGAPDGKERLFIRVGTCLRRDTLLI